jgi:hypothetical protein
MKSGRRKKFTHNPLLCWDISSLALFRRKNFLDITKFREAQAKLKINFDPRKVEYMDFDTIVITDPNEIILWVSPGFKGITDTPSAMPLAKDLLFFKEGILIRL